MTYLSKYQSVWEKEIINYFGSPTGCAKACKIQRSNLCRSFAKGDGYISKNMFFTICRKMDLSPLCFLDDTREHPFHELWYKQDYKMTFAEYEALMYTRQHVDCSLIDHTLRIYAGLSDQELDQLDSKTKVRLQLSITSAISKILSESLPTWN